MGSDGSPEDVLIIEGDMGECYEGWRRCMRVINPKEYQTRKLFPSWFPLVYRNIPKRAIPRMDTFYGKYGSNTLSLD